jgi:hypothetical protein
MEGGLAEVRRNLQAAAATRALEWYPIGGRAFLGVEPARGCAGGRERIELSNIVTLRP